MEVEFTPVVRVDVTSACSTKLPYEAVSSLSITFACLLFWVLGTLDCASSFYLSRMIAQDFPSACITTSTQIVYFGRFDAGRLSTALFSLVVNGGIPKRRGKLRGTPTKTDRP